MFGRVDKNKTQHETDSAILLESLKNLIENSCEALAILDVSGEVILKNNEFKLGELKQKISLPESGLSKTLICHHQLLKFSPLNDTHILAKQLTPPHFAKMMPPLQQLAKKLARGHALFPSLISTLEALLPDKTLLLFKYIPDQEHYGVEAARHHQKDLPTPVLAVKELPINAEHQLIDDLNQLPSLLNSLPALEPASQALFFPFRDKQQNNLGYLSVISSHLELEYELLLLNALTDMIQEHLENAEKKASLNMQLQGDNPIANLPTKQDFEQSLLKVEQSKRNRLLVLVKVCDPHSHDERHKKRILDTIAQLLGSFWRTGDKLFYLGEQEFAILYNNVPDIALVRLRLASMDNVVHYKGFKSVKLKIGYCTLEKADMKTDLLYQQAKQKLNKALEHD